MSLNWLALECSCEKGLSNITLEFVVEGCFSLTCVHSKRIELLGEALRCPRSALPLILVVDEIVLQSFCPAFARSHVLLNVLAGLLGFLIKFALHLPPDFSYFLGGYGPYLLFNQSI